MGHFSVTKCWVMGYDSSIASVTIGIAPLAHAQGGEALSGARSWWAVGSGSPWLVVQEWL